MKFLHLSDLHIGKSVNGFSMIEEQRHAFRQIIEWVKIEHPEAVVMAGDIYDRSVPSTEAVCVFDDFLTELACENTAVMLISGNHDSPERIHFASRLLSDKNLYFYGAFDGEIQKISLSDEHGEVHFWLLPFIKPSSLRGMFRDQEIDSYDDAIAAVLAAANIDFTARNVLVSHQFYTKAGVTPVRSESELNPVGGLDAIDASFIEQFDYAALGHLHGRQNVGLSHLRYCGSPIKYSFSECRQEKAMSVVELGEKGNLTVRLFPLIPLHNMREIKGELEKLTSDEISSLADKEDYLRVILTDEDEIIDPMGKLRSVYPNIMTLSIENKRTSIEIDAVSTDAETMESLSHFELFCEFYLKMNGLAMSEEQTAIVRELLERTGEE